jgi:hypothetical protein
MRHFNRIKDEDGNDTNALEDAMGAIESEWAPLFREVVEAGTFPSSKHREAILTLIATLSLRSGRFRETMMEVTADIHTTMVDMMLASKERWENAHPDADVPYEELKRLWDNREFELSYEQTYFIGHELDAIGTVYETLANRNWCFVRPAGENRFIASDDPVSLLWTSGKDHNPLFPPGHGLAETSVTFALSPELALNGTFEAQPENFSAQDALVAGINGNAARRARIHFFARDTFFSIVTKAGITPATELAKVMRARKKLGSVGEELAGLRAES